MVLRFNQEANSSIGTKRLVVGDDGRHIGGTSNHLFLTTFNSRFPLGIS